MLNILRAYAQRKSFIVNTTLRRCVSTLILTICSLSFMTAHSSPIQTPSNFWAWFATDISSYILQLMQCYVHSQYPHQTAYTRARTHQQITRLHASPQNVRDSCRYVCKPMGHPIIITRQRNGPTLCKKWLLTVLKRILMVKDTTPSWCVMRECGLEPLKFNWFQVAVRLYNALTQSNSSTARKIKQADMQRITVR